MPFSELKSEESQARLSVCKPYSGLQETTRVGGVERYAHQAGDVPRLCPVFECCGHARVACTHTCAYCARIARRAA